MDLNSILNATTSPTPDSPQLPRPAAAPQVGAPPRRARPPPTYAYAPPQQVAAGGYADPRSAHAFPYSGLSQAAWNANYGQANPNFVQQQEHANLAEQGCRFEPGSPQFLGPATHTFAAVQHAAPVPRLNSSNPTPYPYSVRSRPPTTAPYAMSAPPPPPPSEAHVAPPAHLGAAGSPMKRAAPRMPAGAERRRKRTPMRSIGAPVMRAVEGYRDEEDGASARMPLQPYNADVVPNGIANGHPNGNGAALPNGAVHANGRPRDVGGTSGPPNGVAKPLLNQYSNGVSHHGAAPAAPNGVGSTGIVDLTGDDDVVHAAPPAAVQTTPTKAPGPDSGRKKRVSKPISPAARWEAKMEARRSVAGPSSRPASTKAGSSKGRKSSLGNGSTPTAIAPAPAPNGPAPAVVKKVRKKRVRKKKLPPPPDPDVPYPAFSDNFEMSKETVGDMLQVYDFCIAFAKTLRIASFSLRDFEIAVTTPERTPLVDAIVVRCVRTMLNDKAVSLELDLTEKTRQHLKTRKSSEAVEKTFKELAYLFSIDDEGDESGDNSAGNPGEFRGFVDETLDAVVLKMRQTSSTWALYDVLSTDERLRVLRELVDRVASTEEVRACVINSVEFEEEERKKAREDIIVQRREAENELKELRAAHTAFREKHGLTPAAIAAAEAAAKEEAAAAKKASKSKSKKKKAALAKAPSRKELVIKAQKERAAAAKKRKIERDEENLLQKIEKVKTTIKLIKARSAKPGATKREDGEKPTAEEAAEMEKAAEAEIHLDQSERNDEDPVRMHALGTDREHRRYYYFAGGGRLWVEMTKSNVWAYAEETALINGLLEWLSPHRKGERALKTVLEKKLPAIEEDMRRLAKTREKEAVAIANLARAPRTRAGKRKGVSNGDGPAGQSFFI